NANGVLISDPGTSGNQVFGNYLGVDATGTNALPNQQSGIAIQNSASANQIGRDYLFGSAGNVISGNTGYGVYISDTNTLGNSLYGNDIGVGADGETRLGNGLEGVAILNGASSNVIGDGTPIGRNVISGNGTRGVWISDPGTTGNRIAGNYIGVGADSVTAVSNAMEGVVILQGAQGNIIGRDINGQGAGN